MLKRWLMTALESSFGSSAKAPPPVILPLYECIMPGQSRCRFKMHADRRRDERRSPSVVWPRLKVMGLDRRRATGRRGSDIRC